MNDYALMTAQLASICDGVDSLVSNLANASSILWYGMDRLNWAGFYVMREDGRLILGPFQGKTACTEIMPGKGVCGAAAASDRVQLVPDVHMFPGHIACDSASNSEIVIPLHYNSSIWGVLDIDSPELNRFSPSDAEGLCSFAKQLETVIENSFVIL